MSSEMQTLTNPEVAVSGDSGSSFAPASDYAAVRVPVEQSKIKYDRKYAYTTWCPSQGHLYGGNFPGGEVVLSPMTTSEEKILQQQGKDRLEIIGELIRRCLVYCPVAYDDLLVPDMFYMLLMIRNLTYGNDYKFQLECSRCELTYHHRIDLPQGLILRCLDDTDDGEPWEVSLPRSGDTLRFKLLRVKDENDIRRWSRQAYQRSYQAGDPAYTYRLAKHIVSVNGADLDPVKRLHYVEEMLGGDSVVLRRALEKKEFGVDMMIDTNCPGCGCTYKTRMPFDSEFFRPSGDVDQS